MAEYEIETEITIEEADAERLAVLLDCEKEEVGAHLQRVARASLEEYVAMFLGRAVFTRGSDILEWRLLLLTRHLFDGKIPYEQRVCGLFQTTTARSRSLVRSVMSKYQYEIQTAVNDTMEQILERRPQGEERGNFEVPIFNVSVVEAMNQILVQEDGTLPPVTKKPNTVSTYVIRPSALTVLENHLGLSQDD